MVSSNSQVQLMMIRMIKICDDCNDELADNDEASQAIWCALYKQSPGDEGWQVKQATITFFATINHDYQTYNHHYHDHHDHIMIIKCMVMIILIKIITLRCLV